MIKKIKLSKEMKDLDMRVFEFVSFDGTTPSPEDDRDYTPAMVVSEIREFPEEYEAPETEILSQGSIGSCVAHSCATALSSGEKTTYHKFNKYSRGYIYGNRAILDHQGEGMHIRQALKQLNHCGDVFYEDFPYNKKYPEVKALIEENKEKLAKKALPHAIINYYRCYTEADIKEAIMDKGGCIICVPVYTDFSRNLSKSKTKKLRGYHAMVIVGWTKDGQWIVQNSWGVNWGYEGKLLMDKNYPVSEYWGITVNSPDNTEAVEKKDNFFVRLFKSIIKFFKSIFKKN